MRGAHPTREVDVRGVPLAPLAWRRTAAALAASMRESIAAGGHGLRGPPAPAPACSTGDGAGGGGASGARSVAELAAPPTKRSAQEARSERDDGDRAPRRDKVQRAHGTVVGGSGGGSGSSSAVFFEFRVLVVHKALPCACRDCAGLEARLRMLGAYCPRSQLLHEKRQAANRAKTFLEATTTVVVVHEQASTPDVLSFLTLQAESQLANVKLVRSEWVCDSVKENKLLSSDKYVWSAAEPPTAPVASSPKAGVGVAGGGDGGAPTRAPETNASPGEKGGLGINFKMKPLGVTRRGDRAAAKAAPTQGTASGATAASVGATGQEQADKGVIVIGDDDGSAESAEQAEGDDLFVNDRDENGWLRSYGSSDEEQAGKFPGAGSPGGVGGWCGEGAGLCWGAAEGSFFTANSRKWHPTDPKGRQLPKKWADGRKTADFLDFPHVDTAERKRSSKLWLQPVPEIVGKRPFCADLPASWGAGGC